MNHIEAMKLALGALFTYEDDWVEDGMGGVHHNVAYDEKKIFKAITALREALAEQSAPVQGWKLVPVDPTPEQIKEGNKVTWPSPCAQVYSTMLAAAPQPAQRTWVGLSDAQNTVIWANSQSVDEAIRATEKQLMENNK